MARQLTRRGFLKATSAAAAAAGVGVPYFVRPSALGAAGGVAASERITVGHIGVGGRGSGLLGGMVGDRGVQVLAVSDTDTGRRESAKRRVDDRYGTGSCTAYADFRELLARTDVDGVVLASPDHWHALMTILAAKAGKDVYCEKPMASTIADGRAALETLRRHNRVFQTGSHERSNSSCRYACELVLNGRIGKLHTIRTFLPTGDKHSGMTGPEPVPEGFDYDMWLGPSPWEAYHSRRCHGTFRWIMDYSDGELTDRGAHVNDIALLGSRPWLTGPVEIQGRGKCIQDPLWDVPYEYEIEFRYASGLRFLVSSQGREEGRGIRFEGDKGWIFVAIHGGALSASNPDLLKSTIGKDEIQLGRSIGHGADWVRAIKTRGPTMAPAEDGHQTASFCHLSLLAVVLGRKLTWDPKAERFLNDDEANHMQMVHRPLRAPWHL